MYLSVVFGVLFFLLFLNILDFLEQNNIVVPFILLFGSLFSYLLIKYFHFLFFVWLLAFLIICFIVHITPLGLNIEPQLFVAVYFFFPSLLIIFGVLFCFRVTGLCFSFLLFHFIRKKNIIPKISRTEREALLAGTPWIEKEFFTGRPNLKKLLGQEFPRLAPEEEDFLNKPVEELCALSKEWDTLKRRKLSREEEDFLKREKFFGLIIPKKYKGRGFSPLAHAKVIEKLASHNIPLSIIAMVPNSLGPAELLLKYGTAEQKNKYLPKLALGEELPCFGLTEPLAGSDASSIKSEGVLFKKGESLYIRLNWNKRWITLSPKATLIGLAVRLKDPDKLYSDKEELGISCLLISSDSPGITRGLYHDPIGLPIYNAPIQGKDVIVSAEEAIIGGLKKCRSRLENVDGISICRQGDIFTLFVCSQWEKDSLADRSSCFGQKAVWTLYWKI